MLYYVDLFCGAGGTSTGLHQAESDTGNAVASVIACVNHDDLAIRSHRKNHPHCLHFTEDMRTLDLTPIVDLVADVRANDPQAIICLWASLECTHFSWAAGGRSRDEDSRTLADHLPRYVEALDPDYIQIENVREFMSWGPLVARVKKGPDGPCCPVQFAELCEVQDKHEQTTVLMDLKQYNSRNKLYAPRRKRFKLLQKRTEQYVALPTWLPESRTKGKDYMRWLNGICQMGNYHHEHRMLNAADFGAYTSRNRYFGLFAKPGLPVAFPRPTHAKQTAKRRALSLGIGEELKPWRAVRDVLEFNDTGESIFGRTPAMAPKSLERVLAGLVKHVAGGSTAFLSKQYSGNPGSKNISVDGPSGTITCVDHHALVQPAFLVKYLGNDPETGINAGVSLDQTAPTITTQNRLYLAQCAFISQRNGGNPAERVVSVDGPARTITATAGNQELVTGEFMVQYNGCSTSRSVDEPCGTILTKDSFGLVQPQPSYFMANYYSGGGQLESLDSPTATVTTIPKQRLLSVQPFLVNNQHSNTGTALDRPAPTILTGNHHYLLSSEQQSAATLPDFMWIENGQLYVLVVPTDSPVLVKIKRFMAFYCIIDIKMRMLRVSELIRIQGFPEGYYLAGSQTHQKKFLGNAVIPILARRWAEALYAALSTRFRYDRTPFVSTGSVTLAQAA